MISMVETLYRGSVKDVLGYVTVNSSSATALKGLIFKYTDAYSVFDWGRMPDQIPYKRDALAVIAADFFEKLENPEMWKSFSGSVVAYALRKACRHGSVFNELGEELQTSGLRTHYIGVLEEIHGELGDKATSVDVKSLSDIEKPVNLMAVRGVSIVRPAMSTVLGKTLPDYRATVRSPLPRLVPLEVVFRFGCPPSSSLIERAKADPVYIAELGLSDTKFEECKWDFPVMELFTKLEQSDRVLRFSEALAISGLSGEQLQDIFLRTAWVAGFLKWACGKAGLELTDGKLEWAIGEDGKIFLVDAIGPDELRLSRGGVQLSKEFLRAYYRDSAWFESVKKAKQRAREEGQLEWKQYVFEKPLPLSQDFKEAASQLYISLANALCQRIWFRSVWSLDALAGKINMMRK